MIDTEANVRVTAGPTWREYLWLEAALLLFILQIASGSGLLYSSLVFVFFILIALTVKTLGGIQTLTGICVAYFGAQNVIISQIAKVFFWQPADAPLFVPIQTMLAYDIAVGAMLAAAHLANAIRPSLGRTIIKIPTDLKKLYVMSLVTFGLFFVLQLVGSSGAESEGSILSPLRFVNFVQQLCVACSTAYYIIRSGGRQSLGWLNATVIFISAVMGLLGAARQGILEDFLTYIFTLYAFRFSIRPIHYMLIGGALIFAQFILFPYSLAARNYVRTPDMTYNITKGTAIFLDVISDPMSYQAPDNGSIAHKWYLYYGQQIPTLDRMTVINTTDGIVAGTMATTTTNWKTIEPGFEAIIPRYLDEDKSTFKSSNFVAHRAGHIIGVHDFVTGVDVGPVADAFCSFGWLGVVILPFLTSFCFFLIYRKLFTDDIRFNVVAITFIFSIPWEFSGDLISSMIVMLTQGVFVIVIVFTLIELLVQALLVRGKGRIQPKRSRSTFAASIASIAGGAKHD
jgi:hypothetical protein